jgi:hypothetical protein
MQAMVRQSAIAVLMTVALGCTAGTAVSGSETPSKASLQLVRKTPLTVRGQGFRARESVRVSAAARNWRLRASPRGTFVLTLGARVDRCNAVRVLAVGTGGSRAVLKVLASPECPPSKSP